MTDIIILAVIGCILGVAGGYVYREKKKGRKCIGCPHADTCGKGAGNCGCRHQQQK